MRVSSECGGMNIRNKKMFIEHVSNLLTRI